MIVVMNCINLHSMKPAKWLSSPRWMGPRPGKVRTQCGEEGGGGCRGGGAEEGRRKDQAFLGGPCVNPFSHPAQKGPPLQGVCSGVRPRRQLLSPFLLEICPLPPPPSPSPAPLSHLLDGLSSLLSKISIAGGGGGWGGRNPLVASGEKVLPEVNLWDPTKLRTCWLHLHT